jgi:hypothetical protein
MRTLTTLVWLALLEKASGFSPTLSSRHHRRSSVLFSEATAQTDISMDPKEAVKLFGRLAEKYIMLDPTAGMCCYSGCKDCEFRLPDGGYRMADQSASRPKWIPIYETRSVQATGREHTTKWSSEIFSNGPAVNKEEFVQAVTGLEYAPPLGGPYVGASSADFDDPSTAEALFDLLAGDKEKLTKHRMGMRLKELANGEEGINWATFLGAVGAS